MSELKGEQFNEERPVKKVEAEIQPEQPQAEMPDDFEDSEGKGGKWKTVKGEVEIEGKTVEVSYREKVIDLPKHRQEETGIKRIRRRELLPPLPEGLYDTSGKDVNPYTGKEYEQAPIVWSTLRKFDSFYKFLTDDGYSAPGTLVHIMDWSHLYDFEEWSKPSLNLKKHKKEGLYFQQIKKDPDRRFWFSPTAAWCSNVEGKFSTPIFVFGNKNKVLVEYLNALLDSEWEESAQYKFIESLKKREVITNTDANNEVAMHSFGNKIRNYKRPLRWCHAECALVPTKRSLNVLFFETGEEDKKEGGKQEK